MSSVRLLLVLACLLVLLVAARADRHRVDSDGQADQEVDDGIDADAEADDAVDQEEGDDHVALESHSSLPLGETDPFYTDFDSLTGEPRVPGSGEEWVLQSNSVVVNMAGGLAIGNVAAGSHVMVERYIKIKDKHEEATYGWGFLLSGSQKFGGWFGETSCGWYPLQRDFSGSVGVVRKSNRAIKSETHPDHKRRCLPFSNADGQLSLKSILHPRGFTDGYDGMPVVKRMKVVRSGCGLYLNFNKGSQTFVGAPIGSLAAGAFIGRRYIVEGQTAMAALVRPIHGTDTKGWQGWFFMENACLEDLA